MGRFGSFVIGIMIVATTVTAAQAQSRGGIDASGRLLMHGTPRFVLGVYDSGGSYSTDPASWESQIFSPSGARGLQGFPLNVYLNYQMGGMPIGPTNTLLDVLQNHGLMYLQTGNCFADGSWTRYGAGSFSIMNQSYVQQYAQHPAALGYYIMDECDDTLIGETTQHQQQLKAWDPQGLTFGATVAAGYRDPSLWKSSMDIMGTDPYPMYGSEPSAGYTHFIVADFTSKLRAVAPANRPIWTVLQFFKFTSDSRMPTAAELRAHAVMAIVEGAQGLFWWDIGVNGLRQLDAATVSTSMGDLRALTTELAGLEPALLAPPADTALAGNSTLFSDPVAGRIAQLKHNIAVEWLYSRVQWYQAEMAALQAGDTSKSGGLLAGAANVRTRTKIVNGVGYVFAYNYTNQSQPVTFTWQSVPSSVRESKTGQSYALSGASWNDVFGPYEARIYIVNGSGTPPPPPPPISGPSVSFTNPASGATVSGTTTVTVAASGGTGTGYSYQLKVDGTTVYSGTNPSFSWNTATVGNGAHTLTATVTDSSNASGTTSRTVTVSNAAPPSTSFTVSFSWPLSGASVSGGQSVGLSTTATWGQPKTVTLSVDGAVLTSLTITGTTYWYTWDTSTATPGPHTLTASVSMGGQTATATLPVNVAGSGGGSGVASLTVAPSSTTAGAAVTATWSGIASPSTTDWIGLYTPGASDTAYVAWIYVSCSQTAGAAAAAGACSFVIPSSTSPGTYELRLLANNGYTRLAKSNALTVAAGGSPALATLTVSPTTVLAGGSVTASWNGIVGATATDWIGLYVPGTADTSELAWQYVSCSRSPAAASATGSCPFAIPGGLPAGAYELRMFAANGYTRLAASGSITVGAPSGPSLSASPSTVAPGGTVTATWSGIPSPTYLDWVGLYTPDSPDTVYIAWIYVSCTQTPIAPAAAGSCAFQIPGGLTPGTYELRLLANNGYSRLATSGALSVR